MRLFRLISIMVLWFINVACSPAIYSTFADPVDHGNLDKTGTQWFPYLEWRLQNPFYTENPFDLVADVRFVHVESDAEHVTQMFYAGKDTWAFRFTGTLTGEWTFTTSSTHPNLDGLSGAVMIEPNPDPIARGFVGAYGNKWMWTGSEEVFVPQLVMYRTPKYFYKQPDKVEQDIQLWLEEHGFNGLHVMVFCAWFDIDISESEADGTQGGCNELNTSAPNPDLRTFEALERLIASVYEAGGMVHLWMWGDQDRRQTPHELEGGLNGAVDQRLQRYIAARLGPIPGWTMGYGYDNWEWNNGDDQEMWHAFMHEHMGWPHMLGVRWKKNELTQATEQLDYASYEQHKPDYDDLVRAINERNDKPAFSEDRFRGGFPFPDPENKDYSLDEVRRGMWQAMMAGGVAGIWGRWSEDPDAQFGWDEGGSFPFGNYEQIKTYALFFNGRFLKDMAPANSLTDGVALKDMAGSDYHIFYRENATSIRMDLTDLNDPQYAVAVDTRLPYREIAIDLLTPGQHTWLAPYESDWAISVGGAAPAAPET